MNRAISSYSDTSSIDEETLLQQELARLQRQYRVMENERKEVNFYQIKNKQQTSLQTDLYGRTSSVCPAVHFRPIFNGPSSDFVHEVDGPYSSAIHHRGPSAEAVFVH